MSQYRHLLTNPIYRRSTTMGFAFSAKQIFIFSLGWTGYAVTYFLRKPLGIVKGDIQGELNFSSTQLGWMDTALILPYALFQMLLGSIGDRLGAGFTFGVCLILDGLTMITFGWWSNYHLLLVLLFLNGACQSICWPNATKVLSSWFTSGAGRSSVFGLFGTSAFAGGILGTSLVVYLQTAYGWRSAFLLPSLIVGGVGVVVFFAYKEQAAPIQSSGDKEPLIGEEPAPKPVAPRWMSLWSISMVPEVSIAALCIKVVRYGLYGWLPLYLHQALKYSKTEAGMFSTMFDIGGVFGSAFIGLFIDKLFNGRAMRGSMVGILISTVALCLFVITARWGMITNSVLLLLAGAFNCGPDTILVSMVSSDLGNRDGKNAAAAVTGLINGFGSFGSVIQGPVVGALLGTSGWTSVLMFLVATSTLGTAAALRAALLDVPDKVRDNSPPQTV